MSNTTFKINGSEKELYCAACKKHFEDDVKKVKTENNGFICPRSGHMTHYGPWGYAVDKHGIEYTYNEEGNLVFRNPTPLRFLKRINPFSSIV